MTYTELQIEQRKIAALERIADALETPANVLVASLQSQLKAIPKWSYTLDRGMDSRGRRTLKLNVTEEFDPAPGLAADSGAP